MGDNYYGESGNRSAGGSSPIPAPVAELLTDQNTGKPLAVTAIAAGSDHCMALLIDKTVVAWGRNNSGQLGDSTTTDRYTPTSPHGLSNVHTIAAGANNSQASTCDNKFYVWGSVNTSLPMPIPNLAGKGVVLSLSLGGFAGSGYSTFIAPLVVKSDNSLWYLTSTGGLQAVTMNISGVTAVSGNSSFVLVTHIDGSVWSRGATPMAN